MTAHAAATSGDNTAIDAKNVQIKIKNVKNVTKILKKNVCKRNKNVTSS